MTSATIPGAPEEVTADWLTDVLSTDADVVEVDDVAIAPVGTGQTGATYRLQLTYNRNERALPSKFVVKLPSQDPEIREKVSIGYKTEHGFYTVLQPAVKVPMPLSHYCAIGNEGQDFVLIMDDVSPADQGDQVAGCTVDEARLAGEAIAGLHAPLWCDPKWADYPHVVIPRADAATAKGVGDAMGMAAGIAIPALEEMGLGADVLAVVEEAAALTEAWLLLEPQRYSVLHGDFRLDNVLYSPDRSRISVVDWQSLTVGLPARDLAYFVGTALDADVRSAADKDLVAAYHSSLLELGVWDYDLDTCFRDYRLGMLQIMLIGTLGMAFTSTPTHRAEDMMRAIFGRGTAAIRELGSLELIKEMSA